MKLASSLQKAGDVIGRYRLIALLGEGGFGMVWQAEQTVPIHRELALKVIKPGLDSREIIARFEAERQTLALMDHPNIAAVLDAGTTADGRLYFAMELVKGEPITTYCDRHRLGINERLALFIPVCRAVQHAHQKSILHRDLKPSNILVAEVDAKPVSKVIDFGIAKALIGSKSNGGVDLERTQMGAAIGTPRYMSPEQAGSMPDVDTRSDVYSLGVVLCELLTGQSPRPAQPAGFIDALRSIRESEPVKPSELAKSGDAAAEKAASRRGTDSRRLAQRLKGDLDWITLKAVAKDRASRYDTATALARDLEHYLADEPVSAVAPTWRYQFGKFARRQRGALIAASLIGAALVAGAVVSLWQASRANRSRLEAEHRYTQARDAVDKYLVRVTANPKLNQSDFTDLQRELLETALPFYEDLSQSCGDDPSLRSERAWAFAELAKLARHMGDLDKAEAAYRQSVAGLSKLAGQFPEDADRQVTLGLRLNDLAVLLMERRRMDAALTEHDKAVKVVEALASRLEDNPSYQRNLAQVLNDRAVTLYGMNRDKEVAESVQRVYVIGKKLVSRFPKVGDYWLILATAANIEASPLQRQQRYLEEAGVLRQAVGFFEEAAKNRWVNSDVHENLAFNRGRLGMALDSANQPREAESVLRRAVEELQAMVDDFPSYSGYRTNLITFQKFLIKNLLSQNKDAESYAVLERVRANQERLARDFPEEARYSQDLAATVAALATRSKILKNPAKAHAMARFAEPSQPQGVDPLEIALAGLRPENYVHSANLAREAVRLRPADWEGLESAAEVMAGALPFIRTNEQIAVEARDKQLEDYSAQAVDFLKQAMANGYTGMAYFDTLTCAKSLQQRPDYQALLAAPVSPPAHSPRKFVFDYSHEDPGPRHWVRDGMTWTETQPSGVKHVYIITGPIVLDGSPGSKLVRTSSAPQTLFVPDLDAGGAPRVRVRKADGAWANLPPFRDLE